SLGATLRRHNLDVGIRLREYGYGSRLHPIAAATPISVANRVEYRRGSLTEQYRNEPAGMVHTLTLAVRPERSMASQALVIGLDVRGFPVPALSMDKAAVLVKSLSGPTFEYAQLRATDAGGHLVQSHLEATDTEIRVLVDDSVAEYPLSLESRIVDLEPNPLP